MSTDPADLGKRLTKARAQLALNDRLLSPGAPMTPGAPGGSAADAGDDDFSELEFPKHTVPPPPERIDLMSPKSVGEWAARLCVAEEALRRAIAKVGPMPAAVSFYLAKGRGRSPRPADGDDGVASEEAVDRDR